MASPNFPIDANDVKQEPWNFIIMATDIRSLVWRREDDRGHYMITTASQQLDHGFINHAFASEEMYWAKPLPQEQLAVVLSHSITLGLYDLKLRRHAVQPPKTDDEPPVSQQPPSETQDIFEQVGLARFITDHVTTAYLTDVYIAPEYRSYGLGKWLVACCNDVVDAHPALRRVLLAASPAVGKPFYEREMGMRDVIEEAEKVSIMSRRSFKLPVR